MVYSYTDGSRKASTKSSPKKGVVYTYPGKKAAASKTTSKASDSNKTKKPRPSASAVKQELAAQNRGTGKKIGPKARAQRLLALRSSKSTKKQELAQQKRGMK